MKITSNGIETTYGTVYTLFMYGLARGVKYLHKLNIFHRDLKPDNIVVDELHRPHITDYGFSKITEKDVEQSKQVGSGPYMAPEINSSTDYSFPADIFALALIFYSLTELKSIIPKFKANTKRDVKLKIIEKNYREGKMPKLSSENKFSNLIQDMWSIVPEQRLKIEEVCDYLENPDHWFLHTKEEEFNRYKKEIDDFEEAQDPLIKDINIPNKKESKEKKDTNPNRYIKIQNLFKNCSNSNNEDECALGTIFYTGYLGIPKDYVRAWSYFKDAKKHGDVHANSFMMNILNEIIENERKIYNEDFIKSIGNIQDENDPVFDQIRSKQSQLLYGMIKESENEYEKALNLYIKSCKQGCNEAKSRLGSLLLKTNNHLDLSEKLLEETSQWKRKKESCKIKYYIDDNERKLSLLNLGLLKKKKGKFEESIKIFEELLKEDHPDAALLIGSCYEKLKDFPKALEYFKKSMDEFCNSSAKHLYQYYKRLTDRKKSSKK